MLATHHFRHALLVFGLLTVLMGALDLISRIGVLKVDHSTLRAAFAPAATLP
jgi:hypothetical protein